jgi:hypothetical protein
MFLFHAEPILALVALDPEIAFIKYIIDLEYQEPDQ